MMFTIGSYKYQLHVVKLSIIEIGRDSLSCTVPRSSARKHQQGFQQLQTVLHCHSVLLSGGTIMARNCNRHPTVRELDHEQKH